MNNKILMIISSFPPSGESGVQRPVKFLKYLAKDGWETFVITPKRPVMQKHQDATLESEIPSNAKIFKTYTLGINEDKWIDKRFEYAGATKPSKKLIWKVVKFLNDLIFPYDKQSGWVPFALFKAIHVINKYKIRNLYITASPFSAFLCGLILKKLYGNKLFWVADYRDPWQFAPILDELVLPFRKRFISKMDVKFLNTADYITFPTDYVLERYQQEFSWLKDKSEVIANGYDEDDFKDLTPMHFDKFTFLYMGKIHPTIRNPIPLLKAIKKHVKIDYQYIHMGIIGKQRLIQIEEEGIDFYQYLGYKPHKEALSYASGADVNIVINNNDAESVGAMTGKLFELIRIGKPILAIGPRKSIIKDLILKINAGAYAYIEDEEEIIRALDSVISGSFKTNNDKKMVEQYSRHRSTEKLEQIYLRSMA